MSVRGVTVKQSQRLDRIAIGQLGVPSLVLMENAGRHIAREVIRFLGRKRNVLIVCGTGNNAGDGFVAARHLIEKGIKPRIWLIGSAARLKDDAAVNYRILERLKYPMIPVGAGPRARPSSGNHGALPLRDIKKADLVVDAIFGVGLNRDIGEPYRGCIEAVNMNAQKVLSVDIPSGLDGTTGKIYGVCIKAHRTVTFSFPKRGFYLGRGPGMAGKVIVVDIGIPPQAKERIVR